MTSGRLVQFSDVHFGCENKAACEAAIAYAHETANDLVLITGDVTQKGQKDEFEAAGRWIKAMPDPTFVIVGNHDVPYWNVAARVLDPWKAFEDATGHPAHDHQFLSPSMMVRGVVTARGWQARPNWSKGVIDLDQTRKAAQALRQAPVGALRILACHHPLIEMIGTPMTGDVKRGDEAAAIFAEAGVDLIMTGHVHVPFAVPINLADRCSYAVGCGTLSHRLRADAPPSFNQVDWDNKCITVTAMSWTGKAFEAREAWRLPRRQDTRHAETAPSPEIAGEKEKAAT